MRALKYEKVPRIKSSFVAKEEKLSNFNIPWHVHPEFEIALIERGNGTINIGDQSYHFYENELLLLGANLPHSWQVNEDTLASQIIIHFTTNLLGDNWLEKSEFKHISDLLERASRGIRFLGSSKERSHVLLRKILKQSKFDGIIALVQLLSELAKSKDFTLVSGLGYNKEHGGFESKRLNMVYNYMLQNFKDDLSLKTMGELTFMTPASFSRYFKKSTKKSFSVFLNEIRIDHACKLLRENSLSIASISHQSGYSNLSNFNRQFKRIKGISPSEYLKKSSIDLN